MHFRAQEMFLSSLALANHSLLAAAGHVLQLLELQRRLSDRPDLATAIHNMTGAIRHNFVAEYRDIYAHPTTWPPVPPASTFQPASATISTSKFYYYGKPRIANVF